MSLLRLDSVCKSYGGEIVLDGVDLRVEVGDKIGLIGRNGTGKSTIFRLMLGETDPDSGVVERTRKLRIAALAQLPHFEASDTLFDIVLRTFADLTDLEHRLTAMEEQIAAGDEALLRQYSKVQEEFQRRGGYEFRTHVKRVLHGLGFTTHDYDLHIGALSGGQRTRLMLALVLLQDADILLLDEPENHLDLEAREWLESFLKEWPRSFVIISHDRRMLNAVANSIADLERGKVRCYTGNYESFAAQKTLIREQQQKAFERQKEFIEKEEKWIDRFRYKATKATQVQSRIKRLDKIERVDAPDTEQASAKFGLGQVVRSGAVVLEAKGLSKAYGDLVLYRDVSFTVERGERVGIIGPNGAGKTTLLRHIIGRLDDASGKVSLGHKVTLGFYEQHHGDVNPGADIFREVSAARPEWKPEQIRTFLGRFLFTGDDVFKPISALSGGELSRVSIARLILSQANVLLLDEPTNHLDIASREALEAALSEFPGSLLIVSHDRQLIDRLVDKLVIIEHGRASIHLGNYTHYRWKAGETAASATAKSTEDVLKIRRGKIQPARKVEEKSRRKQQKQLEEIERDIASIEEMIAALEVQFTQIDPSDYQNAQQLKSEYDGLKSDLSEMYIEWERIAEDTSA